jgi:ABC-2 type transport system ATP-binding protein
MITVNGVTKRFTERVAVDDVSFTVKKGEVMGFLGPNGAGKTTTMRIITGFMPPTEGSVEVNGLDVFEHPFEVKRTIGYMPEHPPLYLDMTVEGYLGFTAELRGLRGRAVKDAVRRVAETCGLREVIKRLAGNLSKGYRQRVGLAQALVHDPEVLVLDEPTVGLDPRQILEIRQLIKELGKVKTVILSTHVLPERGSLSGSGAPRSLTLSASPPWTASRG